MGNHQSLSSRTLAVLAVLKELLNEKSQETDEPEMQLTRADKQIADRLGHGSTGVVRTELGKLSEAGIISKYTSAHSEVIVTLLDNPPANPQGEEMRQKGPEPEDPTVHVLAVLMEITEGITEKHGVQNPSLARADHEIAKRLNWSTGVVREALHRLAKQGRITKFRSPDSSLTVQLKDSSSAPPQTGTFGEPLPELISTDERLRRQAAEIKKLEERIKSLYELNDSYEEVNKRLEIDVETLQKKLNTANNRARTAHEELREARKDHEGRAGKLRREMREKDAAHETLVAGLREQIVQLEARLASPSTPLMRDILPHEMDERLARALQT